MNDTPPLELRGVVRTFRSGGGTLAVLRGADLVLQAGEIQRLFEEHRLQRTPLPWAVTQKLVAGWDRGAPTPIYEKLGIYRQEFPRGGDHP